MRVRLSDLPLSVKGVSVVAIPVCALLAAMAVFFQFEQETRRAQEWVEHTYQVRSELRQIMTRMIDAEAASRGYLLVERAPFLDRYESARREVLERLTSLNDLVRDNPGQSGKMVELRSQTLQVLRSLDRIKDLAIAKQPLDTAALNAADAEMNQLRTQLAGMIAEEERLLAKRRGEEQEALQRLEAAIFAGAAFGLLGGVIAALIFTKRIGGRIRLLEEEARHVAEGRPVRVEMSGNDEISRLGRTLKATSELLSEQTSELRASHEELESRVARRTGELQAMNEQLREATQVSQAIIGSSPLAIWAIDLEGNVTFWNPAAERIFGWSEAEVIQRPLPVILEDQEEDYRQWLDRFRKGESLAAVERTRQKKDGARVDVLIWTAPLRDAAGRINGTIAIDNDVTEQKKLEDQFRQSQKLEAVGRLAGGVAHDFNNLLTVILGYVEMLSSEAQDRPELLDYAAEIEYAANRASSLTAQLLAFGRRQISQPKVLNLNDVAEHSMKLLRRVIGEDIDIATHFDPALGKVRVDPIHIDQVIMNLVVNARDAMSQGGQLTIETTNVFLDEHYAGRHLGVHPGHYAMLAISDTGAGMSAAVKKRLFEPFFTTKESGKGTGLGLSIVYGIVKQAGGEIMVYSEEGTGTTFKIYLPLSEVTAEHAPSQVQHSGLRGSETVLLCEDEEHIRRLVQTILTKQGYTVLDSDTPEEAIEMARTHRGAIDLLLTDIVMPGKSGFDTAREVQRLRPDIKLLYMSGYTDNRVSSSWAIDPAMQFLQKPFTAAGLMMKVREALGTANTTA